jgi:hypothetical protein
MFQQGCCQSSAAKTWKLAGKTCLTRPQQPDTVSNVQVEMSRMTLEAERLCAMHGMLMEG